jgi:hypothetical protein
MSKKTGCKASEIKLHGTCVPKEMQQYLKNINKDCFQGRHNYIKLGRFVENPCYFIQLNINGKKDPDVRADIKPPTQDHFDYLVHDIKEIQLWDQGQYYKNNRLYADVYSIEDGKIKKHIFKAEGPRNWVIIYG